MARIKKTQEVKKFGGIEELGTAKVNDYEHDVAAVEAQSDTKFEDDKGHGESTVIRCFTFGMNPEAIVNTQPTKQEILNSHIKGIELALFADGLKIFDEVPPRLTFDLETMTYSIFIAARPRKGYLLEQSPKTLTELANGWLPHRQRDS